MKNIICICLLVICTGILYSQTEQDYNERMRKFRESRKIMKISNENYTDYFDGQGYLIKRVIGNTSYIITNLPDGTIKAEFDLGPEGKHTITGSLALFYETNFDPYNLVNNVKVIVDSQTRITEQIITGEYDGSDRREYEYNLLKNFPSNSVQYSGDFITSRTEYKYDGKGILLQEIITYPNSPEEYIINYTYEYY